MDAIEFSKVKKNIELLCTGTKKGEEILSLIDFIQNLPSNLSYNQLVGIIEESTNENLTHLYHSVCSCGFVKEHDGLCGNYECKESVVFVGYKRKAA